MLQPCRARSALPSSTCEKGALLLLPLVSMTSHCFVLVQRLKSAGQICGGCYASAAPKLVHGGSPAGFIKMMPCLHIALSVMATFTDLPARQKCGRPKHHSHHCMALPLASLSGTAAIAAAGRRHRVPLKKIKHLHPYILLEILIRLLVYIALLLLDLDFNSGPQLLKLAQS